MKVADVMHKTIISVSPETPIKEALRLMFGLGISGVLVAQGKKLVGIITEQDVLLRLFPSTSQPDREAAYVNDYKALGGSLAGILDTPVASIMNTEATTISQDTDLMQAQSLMLAHSFSKLPVVDDRDNLVGIISQGDLFRHLLRGEIPKIEKDRFAGFIAQYFDHMVNWKKRFEYEFPALFGFFDKQGVKNVIEIGSWTGEYSMGIAREGGYSILGVDHNPIMVKMSEEKRKNLPPDIQKRVAYKLTNYHDLPQIVTKRYDAAICMGNSLPYIPGDISQVIKTIKDTLLEKNGIFIIQLLNFEKILRKGNRLLNFTIQPSQGPEQEHLSLEFFDQMDNGSLLHHVIIFESDGKNWRYKGITTLPIRHITKPEIEKMLREAGFNDISFSGNRGKYESEHWKLSFSKRFKPLRSDWLNIIAKCK